MKTLITSIYPADTVAVVNTTDGEYRQSFAVSVAKMTEQQQAVWHGALSYLGGSILRGGEVVQSIILELARNAIGVTDVNGEITGQRHEILAAVSVEKTGTGARTVTVSSETLPADLRDGLIAIWLSLEQLPREAFATLSPDPKANNPLK